MIAVANFSTPRWIGNLSSFQDPTSPITTFDKDGQKIELIYVGPYTTLSTNQPARGVAVIGSAGLLVDHSVLKHLSGGRGQMNVICTQSPLPTPGSGESTIKVRWMQLQKPLETNPRYTTGTFTLTADDLNAVNAWKNSSDYNDRKKMENSATTPNPFPPTAEPTAPATLPVLSTNALDLVKKLKKGEESYIIFVPVITRTTDYKVSFTVGGAGFINSPPISIPGFQFLKTADEMDQSSAKFTRNEEWTGANVWDPDLYTTG